jgi:WhiB family transcriptional regulator, redox-sensing transcriptional regulator
MSDWRHRAACRNEDPELFFPVGEGHTAVNDAQVRSAKAVCRRCPVTVECRSFAATVNATQGVFGGMSAEERAAVKRNSQRGNTRRRLTELEKQARTILACNGTVTTVSRQLHISGGKARSVVDGLIEMGLVA